MRTYTGSETQRWGVGPLVLSEWIYEAGHAVEEHRHSFPYWCLPLDGVLEETLPDRKVDVHPGTLVFHPAGEVHAHRAGAHGLHCFHIQPGPTGLPLVPSCRSLARREFGSGALVTIARRIHERVRKAGLNATSDVLTLVGLTLELHGALHALDVGDGDATSRQREGPPLWLTQARTYMYRRLPSAIPLPELADRAGVSVSHLCRTWKRYYGHTVGESMRAHRLEMARRRLERENGSISEIAFACGFADHSHFTRAFRARFGVPPSLWRKATA